MGSTSWEIITFIVYFFVHLFTKLIIEFVGPTCYKDSHVDSIDQMVNSEKKKKKCTKDVYITCLQPLCPILDARKIAQILDVQVNATREAPIGQDSDWLNKPCIPLKIKGEWIVGIEERVADMAASKRGGELGLEILKTRKWRWRVRERAWDSERAAMRLECEN